MIHKNTVIAIHATMLIAITVPVVLILIKHIRNRFYFPLKERSPALTLIFGISTYIAILTLFIG